RPAVRGPDPEHDQREAPEDDGRLDPLEDGAAGARVAAAALEVVLAVEREPERPEDERERERSAGEGEDVSGAAVRAEAVGDLLADVDERAEGEVADDPVDQRGEEDDHGEVDAVEPEVVERVADPVRGEHAGGAGEKADEQHRLLASGCCLVGVVAQPGEDGGRRGEDEREPEPPVALERRGRRVRLCAHASSLARSAEPARDRLKPVPMSGPTSSPRPFETVRRIRAYSSTAKSSSASGLRAIHASRS